MEPSPASPPTDLPLSAAEERLPPFPVPSSSSTAANGLFPAQTSRGGYAGGAGDVPKVDLLRGSVLVGEDLQRELLKERIRQEMIAREMMQIRVLEEEVRKELRIELLLAMRRHHEELVSSSSSFSSSFVGFPPCPEERVLLTRFVPDLEPERRSAGNLGPAVRKSAVHQLQNLEGRGTGFMPLPDAKPSKAYLGGIKRRESELPGTGKAGESAERDWSCALCQVLLTSRELLNQHTQGKKHKARVELMSSVKKAGAPTLAKASNKALTMTNRVGPKKSQLNTKGNLHLTMASSLHPAKKQKTASLRCELCKVECNSDQMLAYHLGGKKHRTKLEKSQRANSTTDAQIKTAAEVPSSKAAEDAKAKSEGADEGTGTVEDFKNEGQEPAQGEEEQR